MFFSGQTLKQFKTINGSLSIECDERITPSHPLLLAVTASCFVHYFPLVDEEVSKETKERRANVANRKHLPHPSRQFMAVRSPYGSLHPFSGKIDPNTMFIAISVRMFEFTWPFSPSFCQHPIQQNRRHVLSYNHRLDDAHWVTVRKTN